MYIDEVKLSGEGGLELLGYTVIASVDSKIEISHEDLLTLTTPLGLGGHTPPKVEANTYVKRAMLAWLKELAQGNAAISLAEEEDGFSGEEDLSGQLPAVLAQTRVCDGE